jgi:hypothetical protein
MLINGRDLDFLGIKTAKCVNFRRFASKIGHFISASRFAIIYTKLSDMRPSCLLHAKNKAALGLIGDEATASRRNNRIWPPEASSDATKKADATRSVPPTLQLTSNHRGRIVVLRHI